MKIAYMCVIFVKCHPYKVTVEYTEDDMVMKKNSTAKTKHSHSHYRKFYKFSHMHTSILFTLLRYTKYLMSVYLGKKTCLSRGILQPLKPSTQRICCINTCWNQTKGKAKETKKMPKNMQQHQQNKYANKWTHE